MSDSTCPTCNGTGGVPIPFRERSQPMGAKERPCPECGGEGTIEPHSALEPEQADDL